MEKEVFGRFSARNRDRNALICTGQPPEPALRAPARSLTGRAAPGPALKRSRAMAKAQAPFTGSASEDRIGQSGL